MAHPVRCKGGHVRSHGEGRPSGEFQGTDCDREVGNSIHYESLVKKRIESEFHDWVQIDWIE